MPKGNRLPLAAHQRMTETKGKPPGKPMPPEKEHQFIFRDELIAPKNDKQQVQTELLRPRSQWFVIRPCFSVAKERSNGAKEQPNDAGERPGAALK